MARKTQATQGTCTCCGKNAKGQSGRKPIHPPPQIMRDFVEFLRARQAGSKPKVEMKPEPMINESSETLPVHNASITNPPGKPSVSLPHGLGTITVPPGAQRVDVRFNCVTNKHPTGYITDNMVVNVDVVYHPETVLGSDMHTNSK